MAQKKLESTPAASGKSASGRDESAGGSIRSGRWTANRAQRCVIAATLLGLILLIVPLLRTGIWDPVELKMADAAVRVSDNLFRANLGNAVSPSEGSLPTLGELGRGELPYTSIALGFRLWGLHDWAGRLPLVLWSALALIAMVAWVYRYRGHCAATWSALVFPTLPIVFFQARFMLGDATTMATLISCFVCLSVACIDAPGQARLGLSSRVIWFGLALVAGGLGVMSRGVLIGIAVPFLAVGLANSSFGTRASRTSVLDKTRDALTGLSLVLGLSALVVAIVLALKTGPVRGLQLVLQGANYQSGFHPHSFDSTVAQLGHGLFPWSGFLFFAFVFVFSEIQRNKESSTARSLGALVSLVFLCATAQTWLGSYGVVMPFPAVVGLAALIGVALDSMSNRKENLRLVSLGTVAVLVVVLADFENASDKILAATASSEAHIPTSFRIDNFKWIQASCVAVFAVSAALGFQLGERTGTTFGHLRLAQYRITLRAMWRSQSGFYVLLVETALVTGAALFWAARFGAPLQRIKDLVSPQREVLAWSWLVLPALGLGVVVARWLLAALDLVFTPGFGLQEIAKNDGRIAEGARRLFNAFPSVRKITLNRTSAWGACIVVIGAVFSVGWGLNLGEQLSPRRALSRYDSLSNPGEPLGLLGVRPQIIQYYSRQRPELLLDPDEAADWLLYDGGRTRWMIVKGDQLPRLNAAYRDRCQCMQNLPIADARSSDMLLAMNRRIAGVTEKNPYDDVLLSQAPSPQQRLDADLGGQVEVLGWEIVSPDGKSVAELRVGRSYELRLYFKVLSRPTLDWETFVHIDGYGRRYNGDHDTTQGRYPATNWRPGDIVRDSSTVVLDPGFSHGNYQLYFGFFKGTRRLEVRRGRQDENRLVAGTIRVH